MGRFVRHIPPRIAAAALMVAVVQFPGDSTDDAAPGRATIGDPRTLRAAYERWKPAYRRVAGDTSLVISLGASREGPARDLPAASGRAVLDLREGRMTVDVGGLPADGAFDVWLVTSRGAATPRGDRPAPGDTLMHLGRLARDGERATLTARVVASAGSGLTLERVVVTRAGDEPRLALVSGGPTLFHRLYHHERALRGGPSPAFAALVPRPAHAQSTGAVSLAGLVAEGERIFFEETFDGNGRTCGTCHPAENNFTIDAVFIERLPVDDPLFVADHIPALASNFENPALMRAFGLILENVDGFEPQTRFVMRGVPHTLALPTSMDVPTVLVDGTTTPPLQRTGWSGDGAPGGGTLREFAIGAVRQHFTLTMARQPAQPGQPGDFRLPTSAELDALEAFQLSLGRQQDPDLQSLTLRGAVAERGRQLFLTDAKCNLCHTNAGANSVLLGGNANFNTGVEALPPLSPQMPRDGGFGTVETPAGSGVFGNGGFNTPPLVEAADTPPFFHNNSVATLEGAVAFYGTAAFNDSPSGQFLQAVAPLGPLVLSADQVAAVAAFLRVLNALENIRSSVAFDERALAARSLVDARKLLQLSRFDIRDAIRVLQEAGLHPTAVVNLFLADDLVERAAATDRRGSRNALIGRAIDLQERAREDLQ